MDEDDDMFTNLLVTNRELVHGMNLKSWYNLSLRPCLVRSSLSRDGYIETSRLNETDKKQWHLIRTWSQTWHIYHSPIVYSETGIIGRIVSYANSINPQNHQLSDHWLTCSMISNKRKVHDPVVKISVSWWRRMRYLPISDCLFGKGYKITSD